MEERERAFNELDSVLACCEATGLSCLMLAAPGETGVEPLIGNRDTIEQLVAGFEGTGTWLILKGQLVNPSSEPVPLTDLRRH